MAVFHVQFMALGLAGVQTPLLVDVITTHKHPRLTVQAIEHLIAPTARYALDVLKNIIVRGDIGEDSPSKQERLNCLSKHLEEDPHGMDLMGGAFTLIGLDVSSEDVARAVANNGCDKPTCGPDAAISLKEHPDVVLSFHASNNNGGNTYAMTRAQFTTLFPNEPIEELTLNDA
jgi:hypothetical protein